MKVAMLTLAAMVAAEKDMPWVESEVQCTADNSVCTATTADYVVHTRRHAGIKTHEAENPKGFAVSVKVTKNDGTTLETHEGPDLDDEDNWNPQDEEKLVDVEALPAEEAAHVEKILSRSFRNIEETDALDEDEEEEADVETKAGAGWRRRRRRRRGSWHANMEITKKPAFVGGSPFHHSATHYWENKGGSTTASKSCCNHGTCYDDSSMSHHCDLSGHNKNNSGGLKSPKCCEPPTWMYLWSVCNKLSWIQANQARKNKSSCWTLIWLTPAMANMWAPGC
jgi:hypothetical protein